MYPSEGGCWGGLLSKIRYRNISRPCSFCQSRLRWILLDTALKFEDILPSFLSDPSLSSTVGGGRAEYAIAAHSHTLAWARYNGGVCICNLFTACACLCVCDWYHADVTAQSHLIPIPCQFHKSTFISMQQGRGCIHNKVTQTILTECSFVFMWFQIQISDLKVLHLDQLN